ncbi:MAG: hypothetical protein WBQ59_09870 [Candidatus Acidiferrum sp.]
MLKYEVSSRTFYREDPLTAGHPVTGTQITILALERDGLCLVGDSPVTWDEANKKNIAPPPGFDHYEKRRYSEQEADKIVEGKVSKVISDGYAFEVVMDWRHFVQTGEVVFKVHQHTPESEGSSL